MRGLGSHHPNKVLVMVNGTPYKDGFYQDFIYDEYFPLEIIERIECIRGPGSVLYGSNALTGVINIITKKATDLPDSGGDIIIKGGSRQTFYFKAQAASQAEKSSFTGHVRYFQSDNKGPEFSHRGTRNIEEAGHIKIATSAAFRYASHGFYLSSHIIDYFTPQIVEADRQHFGNNGGWSRYNIMSEAGYNKALTETFIIDFKMYWQYYDNHSRWGSALLPIDEEPLLIQTDVNTETERFGGGFQAEWSMTPWNRIVLGLDYELNRIIEKVDYEYHSEWDNDPTISLYAPATEVYETGLYVQDTLHFWQNKIGLTLGARLTNNELFGDFLAPRGGIVISPQHWLSLKLLYGEAYRSPNGRELFTDPDGDWTAGNRELDPEEIRTIEAQCSFQPRDNLTFTVTYCDITTENDIEEAEELSVPSQRQWKNLEGTDTTGFEATFQYEQKYLSVFSNLGIYDITDKATNEQKKFVPETLWNVGFSLNPSEDFHIMVIWNHVGERDNIDMTREYFDSKIASGSFDPAITYEDATRGGDPYDVVDLTMTWNNLLDKKFVDATFSIYNLIDEEYSDFPLDPGDEGRKLDTGYERQGRTVLLSLQFTF